MIKAVGEKTSIVICPNCHSIFKSDASIQMFVIDTWLDPAHTIHKGRGYYECPICGERQDNLEAFYGVE